MKYKMIFLGVITAGIISGCNMNRDKNNEANMSAATDSSMMTKADTGMMSGSKNSNMPVPADVDSATGSNKVAMAKPDPTKKGKKGKVIIVMDNIKGTGDMNMDKEGYYNSTEILPAFPGGQKALANFFEKNIQYPQDATDNGVEGNVKINFAVDENGKVYAPKIISDNIGYGIEKEALRAFSKMPAWTPGKIKGRNVKTRFTLPITFQLY